MSPAVLVEVAAAIASGIALYVAWAGPWRIDLPGIEIGIRTPLRPVVAAVGFVAARVWLASLATDRPRSRWTAIATPLSRAACGGMMVAGAIGWFTFLSATCGGADSYGYVSAADRLLAGRLVEPEPLATLLPFPRGIEAATPLGYVPSGRTTDASVPAYPLGLPALMAALRTLAGPIGPFLVAPLAGLLLLAATCAIAYAWYGSTETALLAGALVAVNPLVFTYAIQPMSDVPAAAAAALAIAGLCRRVQWPILSGVAAGTALLIRPALAPMAVAIAAIPLLVSGRRQWMVSLRCLIPIALAIVVQGWTQWFLYGDAFASGYGSVVSLFSIERAWFNTKSYGFWGLRTLGPVWIGGLAIGLVVSRRQPRVVAALVAVSVGLPYLFYRPYDHWETLRFLLPAIVVFTIVAAAGLTAVARALTGATAGPVVAAVIAIVTAWTWMSWLSVNHVFSMPASEARHRVAADLVMQTTPERAVILALQHSGSLRYYARRQTVNWDRIPAGSFDATVRALEAGGYPVYLMIDSDAERTMFEARHGAVVDRERWLPNGQRGNVQLFEKPRS